MPRIPDPRHQRKPKQASKFRLPGSPPGPPTPPHRQRASRPCTCDPLPCDFLLGADPAAYHCTPGCLACRPVTSNQTTVRRPATNAAVEYYRHAAADLDAILADLTEAVHHLEQLAPGMSASTKSEALASLPEDTT